MPARSRSLGSPDEIIRLPGIIEEIVEIGEMTVGRTTQEPGWRWSTHLRSVVGGEWCEARHIGVVLSGRFGVDMRDGTSLEFGPDDVYDIPPGHDGFTIGDEPAVMIEWSGLRALAGSQLGFHGRVLATILFTDLVDSTAQASRMGDVAWGEVMARHYQAVRGQLERFHGREIATTGDGMLAVFDAPAPALRCAAGIHLGARGEGLGVRIGVHVGEVDAVGTEVKGIAVHEAARVMAAAQAGETLVSDTVRALASATGFSFEDRGTHELKGIPEPVHLFACVEQAKPDRPAATGAAPG